MSLTLAKWDGMRPDQAEVQLQGACVIVQKLDLGAERDWPVGLEHHLTSSALRLLQRPSQSARPVKPYLRTSQARPIEEPRDK